jgi:hypothetical protein
MSKGLGKLQKDVLAVLADKGKWLYSWEIVTALCERDGKAPTHSFDVSLRRAASSLAKKGLIQTGENQDGQYRPRNGGYERLACWLPEHPKPPRLVAKLDARTVEQKVLHRLNTLEPPLHWGGRYKPLKPLYESGDVAYDELKGRVRSDLIASQMEVRKAEMAIYRALLRLEKTSQITVKRFDDGKIGLLRLNA